MLVNELNGRKVLLNKVPVDWNPLLMVHNLSIANSVSKQTQSTAEYLIVSNHSLSS